MSGDAPQATIRDDDSRDHPYPVGAATGRVARSRGRRRIRFLRGGVLAFLTVLVIEYLVIPQLVDAGHNLPLLHRVTAAWVVAAVILEAASVLCYALLTRALLARQGPGLFVLIRIVLTTTGIGHVVPGGAAVGAGLGYRLLTESGVDGPVAATVLATESVGSAVVLNTLLWISLVLSIPFAGLHPIYVVIALVGVLLLLATSALIYSFTRGEERSVRAVRAIGRRIPRVGADRLEHLVRQIGDAVTGFGRDPVLLRRATLWAALNWLLDAASLWAFIAAFGHDVDPVELFAAYGIANVLAAIPLTPGGLGIVEASAASLLVSFGLGRAVATLGVLGWRLVNFWLPIPLGTAAFVSLRLPGTGGRRQRLRSRHR